MLERRATSRQQHYRPQRTRPDGQAADDKPGHNAPSAIQKYGLLRTGAQVMKRMWQAWGKRPFQFGLFAAAQLIVLTLVAMLLYPGGTVADPASRDYDFFKNFFSDLGRTVSPAGEPNTVSAVLFVVALTVAGLGLVSFFVAGLQFFWQEGRLLRTLGILTVISGLIAGLSFVGVAWTPANLRLGAHGWFVGTAFRAFLAAVLFQLVAVVFHRRYPKVYAAVYAAFALLLASYLWLLFEGPRPDSPAGLAIQATGQKIIVYAALLTVLIQSYGAIRLHEAGLAQDVHAEHGGS